MAHDSRAETVTTIHAKKQAITLSRSSRRLHVGGGADRDTREGTAPYWPITARLNISSTNRTPSPHTFLSLPRLGGRNPNSLELKKKSA